MKRQQFLSKAIWLASVVLTSFWLHPLAWGQDSRSNKGYSVEDKRADLVVQLGHSTFIDSVAFSADGKYVLTGSHDKTARLWEAETGKEVRQFVGHSDGLSSVAFSADGKYVLTGSSDKTARLWETATGKEVRRFVTHSDIVFSVAFSADGKYLLTGDLGGTVQLWETATGKQLRQFVGHAGWIRSVIFSPDSRYVLTGSYDSTTRLWDISTGKEVCSLVSFQDGTWTVIAPDGRFDTSNLEEIKGLHWVMPDDPMRTYPLEIFMRDYYEPLLLPRLLNGEQLRPIPPIAALNRVQPKVVITGVGQQKDNPYLATVFVKVSKASGEFKQGDKKITRETEVYDLRLFRDGQLVAVMPDINPTATASAKQTVTTPEQIRKAWRESARVKLEANGEQIITFENIHIPRRAGAKEVEFAAYAFNEDRVKSQTHKESFYLPENLAPVKGRTFLLTVGVNAYENSAWNLRFAANDARLAQNALSEGLKQSGEFTEVVNMSLISEAQPAAGARPATKANIKAALEQIARQATPEDLVMIYYASHGYADRNGNYYFLTADTGPGRSKEITPELLRRSISSDELMAWLKDVDAGEIVLIVDACQSAGTVKGEAGEEFKPGPMGSRGLGQLAYDKRMQILAASQADDFAFEIAALQHGLLTYALMMDGIEGRKGDLNRDGQITLSEALAYSLKRVPKLYEAMRRGKLAEMLKAEGNRGPQVVGGAPSLRKKYAFQQPSLFDFAKKRREIVLAR